MTHRLPLAGVLLFVSLAPSADPDKVPAKIAPDVGGEKLSVAAQQINTQQQQEMNAMAFFGAPPSPDIASLYNSTGPLPPQ